MTSLAAGPTTEPGERGHFDTTETQPDRDLPAAPTRLRSDAARNRNRILAAAAELFAQRGVEVPMSAIARRAGVGVATLFRRFPNRQTLISEVFARQFDHCDAALARAVEHPDPWEGFRLVIEAICDLQMHDRGFTEAFLHHIAGSGEGPGAPSRVHQAFAIVVHRAQQAGRLRRDVVLSDLSIILLANAGLRAAPGDEAEIMSRRLVGHLLRSFATDGSSTLPPASRLGLSDLLLAP
jgi:AcrR family transcriptional regulator